MRVFSAHDATLLAYGVQGEGARVICLPGGPMQDSTYLGDLGGLSAGFELILLDPRGSGRSAKPVDTTTYRCDHLVDDVEALREHLGLDRIDLLAHSAGANLAVLYAARHPERIRKLVLVTPSTYAVGINASSQIRREVVRLRRGEPWFAPASAAFEAIQSGQATDSDWEAVTPFTYGRWDETAQAHHASGHRNEEAATMFGAEGAFDPPATRAALAALSAPVLLLAGEVDVAGAPIVVAEMAALFANATLAIQPAAGHFPWLDDPVRFTSTIAAFLK